MKAISKDLGTLTSRQDLLAKLLPNQVLVEKADLMALQGRVVTQENQLRTALGTLGIVVLLSAPAAALSARGRGAKLVEAIGAGLLGPLYLAYRGYREGLR
jgi:hypothetical protein